jgi:hypothetical protein
MDSCGHETYGEDNVTNYPFVLTLTSYFIFKLVFSSLLSRPTPFTKCSLTVLFLSLSRSHVLPLMYISVDTLTCILYALPFIHPPFSLALKPLPKLQPEFKLRS